MEYKHSCTLHMTLTYTCTASDSKVPYKLHGHTEVTFFLLKIRKKAKSQDIPATHMHQENRYQT
jgi:uncharacterized metal-binding protein YceD (DUF177 family)